MNANLAEWIVLTAPVSLYAAAVALAATGYLRRGRHVPPGLPSVAELGAFDRLGAEGKRRAMLALRSGAPGETPQEAAAVRTLAQGDLHTQFNPWYFAAQIALFGGIGLQGLRWIREDLWSFWGTASALLLAVLAVILPWQAVARRRRHRRARAALAANAPDAGRGG